ncbi:cyclic nucleotide-gated ion channel [Bradyrhizobium sp.]|uniref:cyclic nucleotide-gated ion channel n=1 Tax=Bradyrhizobium sp. TaxID=376 RepID=UPI00261F93C8|nr:cyclic nucleotide-gated ion channel [Bradyrhizobium sp.]
MSRLHRLGQLRPRLYNVFESGPAAGRLSATVNWILIGLIVVTLAATVLESVPRLTNVYGSLFEIIEFVALATFSFEYLVRLWTAIEHPPWRRQGAIQSRLRFAASPAGIVDLAAVLPFWLSFAVAADFKALLVLRLIRFFKLTRYSPAMRSLLEALYAERRALLGCFVILCGATLIAAALMHLAEGAAQPDKFGTIPDAMWWAIVTLGTIGYGDAVPITVTGRLIASLAIFVGLLMVALPVGIVATAFANEVHRRDFVVTWGLVARIPLFGELTAVQIADVMKLLRAQKVDKGTIIARRGEPAHSMYLIVDGEVEIKLRHQHVRLGGGDFFGEVAALRQSRRSATVVALCHTRLLALDAADLHSLMDREPQIAARIWDAARERLGRELETAAGDLVTSELSA